MQMKATVRLLLPLLIFCACGIRKAEVKDGYAHLRSLTEIKPKLNEFLPVNFRLYAPSDTTGVCFVEVNPADLLIKRDSLDEWSKNARFQLNVRKNNMGKEYIHRLEKSWVMKDEAVILDSFQFNFAKNEDVLCELILTDFNKHNFHNKEIRWSRKQKLQPQHFVLIDPAKNIPAIQTFCKGDTLKIRSDHFQGSDLRISLYKGLSKPASSPFSWGNSSPDFQKPDSVYSIRPEAPVFEIPLREGFATISLEDKKQEVAGFFTYSSMDRSTVFKSMEYFSTSEEVARFRDTAVAHIAYNEFWEKASGKDAARRKRLEEAFLERVSYADKHFSSYKPGSLTDRGMIYIVFGEPERMQMEGFQEIWIYQRIGMEQTGFVFLYDRDEIAPNNCYLERAQHFKSIYYMAVESWRTGLVNLEY